MKKLFIAAILVAAIGTSAFAFDTEKVSYKVKNSFESQFTDAKNVQWTLGANYTKASFVLNEAKVEAFYSFDGEMIGTTKKVDFKKLPLKAIQKIQKEYASYKVEETILFEQEEGKTFYVSLADGNRKQILEVSIYGGVSTYTSPK